MKTDPASGKRSATAIAPTHGAKSALSRNRATRVRTSLKNSSALVDSTEECTFTPDFREVNAIRCGRIESQSVLAMARGRARLRGHEAFAQEGVLRAERRHRPGCPGHTRVVPCRFRSIGSCSGG